MLKRDQLTDFVHKAIGQDLLEKVQTMDQMANGVQIHGKDQIKKVALGVSANLDFFAEAVKAKADYCIFHHGLALNDKYIYNSRPDLGLQRRLKHIFANDLTIAGYHLSLDIQPEFGNNAVILDKLGAKDLNQTYFMEVGRIGEFATPQPVEKLAKKCSEIFNHDVFAVYSGPKMIKRVGVCSGAGKPYGEQLQEIMAQKIDLHLTGEISESGPGLAKDLGFNYFAAGHYATEVFGVQELGKRIKENFGNKLEVEFIDLPNPL